MTAGHGEKLSRNQERAIAALLSKPSVIEAAKEIGVAEKTLRRWIKLSHFRDAYRDACRQVVEAAINKLQGSMKLAVDELVSMLTAEETKFFSFQGEVVDERNVVAWGIRLGAAKAILDMGVKAKELLDLEARVEKLEDAIKERSHDQNP